MRQSERIHLPVWAGYRAGKSASPSRGDLDVRFHSERLSDAQRAAYASIGPMAATLQPLLLKAIVAAYPRLREWHPRPKTVVARDLVDLVAPYGIIVLRDDHDGFGYLAYGFSCAWDPSGIHIVVHRDRVVATGSFEVLAYPIRDPDRPAPKAAAPTPAALRSARVAAEKRARKNPAQLQSLGELEVALPVWAGFRSDPFDKPSRGNVLLSVGGDSVAAPDASVTAEQQAAYRGVVDDAAATQRAILDAILAAYPRLRSRFDGFETTMPATVDAESLRELVELTSVTLHAVHADGVSYVGYGLACAWDGEHALGAMTHRGRVVELGGADTAILGWLAERDRQRTLGKAPPAAARKAKPAAAKLAAAGRTAKPAARKPRRPPARGR